MKVPSNAEARPDPCLTFNGVVKVMAASSAKEREALVHDYKYPEPEGKAKGYYYGIARDTIRKYHVAHNDCGTADTCLEAVQSLYKGANAAKASKLDNNVRAARAYLRHFGDKKYVPQDASTVIVECEGVSLRMRPDFLAAEGKRMRLVRYDFSQKGATDDEIRFSLQMLFFYARAAGLEVQNSDCQLLLVADGSVKTLSGVSTRFEPNLKSAMREVRRIWADL